MSIKIISKNRQASYEFFLQDRYEAGLVLQGTEVKSIRVNGARIEDAYIDIDSHGEAWAYNIMIAPYEFGNRANHVENRKRKLLLGKKEIAKIWQGIQQQRLTVVPTMIYFKDSLVKIEIALAKGKNLHDKRSDKAKKDVERKLQRKEYD